MEGDILKSEMGMQRSPHGIFLSLGGRWFLTDLPRRRIIRESKKSWIVLFVHWHISLPSEKHQLSAWEDRGGSNGGHPGGGVLCLSDLSQHSWK